MNKKELWKVVFENSCKFIQIVLREIKVKIFFEDCMQHCLYLIIKDEWLHCDIQLSTSSEAIFCYLPEVPKWYFICCGFYKRDQYVHRTFLYLLIERKGNLKQILDSQHLLHGW
jgi:hypothetical protein